MAGKEKVKFWKAENDVVELAEKLMASYNKNALDANIGFRFRSKCAKRGGKTVLARTMKQSDSARIFNGELDFVIEIGDDGWQMLDDTQREALLLHEILHIKAEVNEEDGGTVEFGMNDHDVAEFRKIIEVYGFWMPDLEELAKTVEERLALNEETDKKPTGKKTIIKKMEEIKFDQDDEGIFKG